MNWSRDLPTPTLKQFNSYLAAKAPEKPCPECGVNHWLMETDIRDPEPLSDEAMLFTGTIPSMQGTAIAVYPMFCSNCGFVKNFASMIVSKWVSENG